MKQNYSTFAKRLRHIIGNESLLSFSKKCRLSESAIRKYIKEESEPTLRSLLTMAKVGNVSVTWLATGNDPFLSNISFFPNDTKNRVITIPEIEFNHLLTLAHAGSNNHDFVNYDSTSSDNLMVLKEEQIITRWVLSRDWLSRSGLSHDSLAIVQIPYNNMDSTIKDGDIAIINLTKKEEITQVLAGVYIILLNDKLLIKRIEYDPIENGYHLINDNPSFKNHLIKQDKTKQNHATQFQVIAKIAHILTNVS